MIARLCMNCYSCYSVGNKNTLIFPIVFRHPRTFIQLTTFCCVCSIHFIIVFVAKRNLISGNAHFLHSILLYALWNHSFGSLTQFNSFTISDIVQPKLRKRKNLVSHRWTHSGTHATKLEQNERNGSNCWTTSKVLEYIPKKATETQKPNNET